FVYRNLFLVGIDYEDDIRQHLHIAYPSEVLFQSRMFALQTESLLLCESVESAVGAHLLDVFHPLDRFLNRLEVCKQASQPALIDVVLTAAFRFFFDGILCLPFCSYEHEAGAVHSFLSYKLDRFFEQPLGFLKVNDVNAVAFAEDVLLHLRIPTPDLVSKMDASLKQFLH